ncbi:DegV family protein [Lachnospiraceae bacterium YH-ros2228]
MYRILIDSCGELFPEMVKDPDHFASIPLTLEVGNEEIPDDESFDQKAFLKKVKESPTSPKSACPSPDAFIREFKGADRIYIITLSSKLSGSYNSACLARDIYLEDMEDEDEDQTTKIHVFDSKSASIGQTLIGKRIAELEESGASFEEVVKETDAYIEEEHTFFILETLETLQKAGRLSGVKAMLANALNIKPVMGSTPQGSIQQLGQGRGMIRAIDKMIDEMLKVTSHPETKCLAISHCNAPETAEKVKEAALKKSAFREIKIVPTRGVSSMYANDGGIILVI